MDVLVNNAGFWDDSPEGWRKSVDVNIVSLCKDPIWIKSNTVIKKKSSEYF